MIELDLSFRLPFTWENQLFEAKHVGTINFLVGPNGSGKSQFATALYNKLKDRGHSPKFLGTDRLSEMAVGNSLMRYYGDPFATGFPREQFGQLKSAGEEGSGIDTLVVLEERVDLRIQIEATLSHLFDREINLEWDSGNLVGNVRRRGASESYRLDREECHGIKELLVLLTHLYNEESQILIIDEPELNLHPQYQAFFMQEARKLAGNPAVDNEKKIIFLITHSPFILDFRSVDDLKSVISFDLEYSVPKQIANLWTGPLKSPFPQAGRLNAHHKQLFFSDNPIFVEGIGDAELITAMMEARGVSVAGAGSCIIDAGGAEEVNHYLRLCKALGKAAYFLYDLDSLFRGNLRSCIREDRSIGSFLASAGLGSDFGKYCGELDRKLTDLIDQLLAGGVSFPPCLVPLSTFLSGLKQRSPWTQPDLAKARIAVMTALSKYRDEMVRIASRQLVEDIEGRRHQILMTLEKKNIFVLPGGTIERYLPAYSGGEYELNDDAKRKAVFAEIGELANSTTDEELAARYQDLYTAVCKLPGKKDVDVDPVLRSYLSDYIHGLQKVVQGTPCLSLDQMRERLKTLYPSLANIFSIVEFERKEGVGFEATIEIGKLLGRSRRVTHVGHHTNAGMGDFEIVASEGFDSEGS